MSENSEAKTLFEKAESDITTRWDSERANLFLKALKEFETNNDAQRVQEMKWEILLFNLRYLDNLSERKNTGRRFAPLVEYTNGTVFPDIRAFTDNQLNYYKKRTDETSNPIHRARYNDIVWELRKEHVFARKAIDAYLDCVDIYYKNDWQNEIADSLVRAAELSIILNDTKAVKIVKEQLLYWIQTLAKAGKFRYCIELIDVLIVMKKFMSTGDLKFAVDISTSAVAFYGKVKDGYNLERAFLELIVRLMICLKKPEEAFKARVQIAESFVREGDWKLINYPSGDLVAVSFYEQAAFAFRKLGLTNEVEKLLKRVKEHSIKAESSFKEIRVAVTIPQDPVENYIQSFNPLDLSAALEKISLEDFFIPDVKNIRSELEQQKGKSLAFVIPRVSIRNSNSVLKSRTEDEIFEDLLIERIVMEYKLKTSILGNILDNLKKTKNLDHKNMLPFLLSSNVYKSISQEIVEVGLERYFKDDFVSSLHILIPQLERVFRSMLQKLDLPTTTIEGDTIEEKTLGSVLRETKIKEFLGENIYFYVSAFLVDKRGDNLRNDVMHGLATKNTFVKNTADTLLHILILLTRFG